MNYINEILVAIPSAIIGGFITLIFERRKERRQDKKELEAKKEELHRNRPELSIIEMKDYFSRPGVCITSQPCDLEAFIAPFKKVEIADGDVSAIYDESYLDKKSWACRIYVIKNVGKSAIYSLSLISNYKKDTCIFEVEALDKLTIEDGYINYYVSLDKRIAPDETFTLKLCYPKDKVVSGFMSAIFSFGLCDDNEHYWEQPFFAPGDKLYVSQMISYREYRDQILPDSAIECFKKPYLW